MALGRAVRFRVPVWQFRNGVPWSVRGEVSEVLATFRAVYPDIRPLQIAVWAMTPQPELKDETPADWLQDERSIELVVMAARRAAAALAQ